MSGGRCNPSFVDKICNLVKNRMLSILLQPFICSSSKIRHEASGWAVGISGQ